MPKGKKEEAVVAVPEQVEQYAGSDNDAYMQESEEETAVENQSPIDESGFKMNGTPIEDEDSEDVNFYPEETEDSPFGIWSSKTAEKKGFKLLLYGPPGSGKTRMGATFPNPLFLDLESGMRSTLPVKEVLRYPADPKEEVKSYLEVYEFYKMVKRVKNPAFETIVIDSINELQVLVMNHVVGKYTQANRQYDDQFTQADYGKANRDLLKIIRLFLKLPYHIIFTGVETPRTYPEQQVYLQLKGKEVWPEFQRIIEMIGYCHVKKGADGKSQHLVSFHLTPTHIAKDRLGIVERDIPNDYENLAKYVNS